MSSGPISTSKISIDKPHEPWGSHVDLITRIPEIGGAEKIRIDPNGKFISREILVGKQKIQINRDE